MDRIRTGREKILTVEDPVEYELAGVPQVPVNEKVGVTFATAFAGEPDLPDVASRGAGCADCRGTGYHGRTGIYELLVLDEEIRRAVVSGGIASEIRGLAVARGMRTLRQDGLALIRSGITTVEEVLRAGGA